MLNVGHIVGSAVDVLDQKASEILARCSDPVPAMVSAPVQAPQQPIAYDEWPILFRLLAGRRKETDAGLGDVVERLIGPIGGDAFKTWFKLATGRDCGCGARKEFLNQRYPLKTIDNQPQSTNLSQ